MPISLQARTMVDIEAAGMSTGVTTSSFSAAQEPRRAVRARMIITATVRRRSGMRLSFRDIIHGNVYFCKRRAPPVRFLVTPGAP